MTRHFDLQAADGGITVVSFVGPKIVPEAEDTLDEVLADRRQERLLLDLEKVQFLSSNALAILVRIKRRLEAAGGRLRLCGLSADLRELLFLTRTDELFEVFDSRQNALQRF